MAARRLLIVMLVFLGISTIAAALVPQRPSDDGGEQTAATEAGTGAETESGAGTEPGARTEAATGAAAEAPGGEQLVARIFVGGRRVPVVPVALGDRLRLTVCTREVTDLLEVPALGRFDPISPGTAVLFDFLPGATGSYAIRFVERDALAARIRVTEAPREPAAPAAPESAPPSECPAPAPR